ncbi:MAG: molybdopterin adenylyltransferase [Candidatus Anammoxibacter sp.]
MIRAGILTISDKGSRGEREDKSGEVIKVKLKEINANVTAYEIIPDEKDLIIEKLLILVKSTDLILTTGGTGVSPRDVTPEATLAVIEKELPGFGEVMRSESFKITPRAIGSRAIAGIRDKTLIINLPGSPKAVSECLGFVISVIPHTINLIKGNVDECAR